MEIRRANDALVQLEGRISWHREHVAMDASVGLACCGRGDMAGRHLEVLDGERERLEVRLRELLGDAEE